MVSERGIRTSHTVLFALILIASIITLAISASLVSHYNGDGYPMYHTTAYKERIRILLVASVWTVVFGSTSLLSLILGVYIDGRTVVLTVGFQVMGNHLAFGVLAHLVRDLFQSIWIDID